jgi:hypothetical protein
MSTLRRLARAIGPQALAGLVVWAAVVVVAANVDDGALDLLAVLLLLGQLVVVPLGLLMVPAARSPLSSGLARGGRVLFRVGAVAALASLAVPRGEASAAIAALYLLPALLVGASALIDLRRLPLGGSGTPEIAGVAARLMLVAGALLFVLHRQDVAFARLPELGVRLAAVHLHFVGFGLLLMAGTLARRARLLGGAASWLLIVGTLPASVGTLVAPALQAGGALLVLAGLVALMAGTFTVLGDADVAPAARRLLFVSLACSAFVGATAALSLLGAPMAELSSMVRLHGTFAAAGVVVMGLIGWRLVDGMSSPLPPVESARVRSDN